MEISFGSGFQSIQIRIVGKNWMQDSPFSSYSGIAHSDLGLE